MALQDQIVAAATELGFKIVGMDETHAGISGVGVEFVGTHAEVHAYLTGWFDHQGQNPRVLRRSILVVRNGGPYTVGVPTVLPGEIVQITVRPQSMGFKGDRIAIPDSIASHFEIVDITIGNRSQLPMSQTIPGETFSTRLSAGAMGAIFKLNKGVDEVTPRIEMTEAALAEFGREFDLEMVQHAMDVIVTVRLLDSAPGPMAFTMLILGTLVPAPRPQILPRFSPPGSRASFTPEQVQELVDTWGEILNREAPP